MSDTQAGNPGATPKPVIEDQLFRIISIQAKPGTGSTGGKVLPKTRMVLQNAKFASLQAIDWTSAHRLNEGEVVKISGTLKDYKGQPQLTLSSLAVARDFDPRLLLPTYPGLVEQLEVRLQTLITGIADKRLSQIACQLLDPTTELGQKFRLAPGSTFSLGHEPYIHGLMHHLVETAELATAMASQFAAMRPDEYGSLNLSYVTFGALLHDIGKTSAYTYGEHGFKMSYAGSLNGHLVQSSILIDNALRESGEFDELEIADILHLVISHHGPESDQPPRTMEAMIVHKSDNICSDLGAKFGYPNNR